MTYKSPYPYFGGKSRIAHIMWDRLNRDGAIKNLVIPFFGSGAELLARPDFDPEHPPLETVNDLHGFIPNFWRAIQKDPEAVAHHADWPVSECDLHARHIWLVGQKDVMQARLERDPEWYDAKVAGWWVWGMACWIGRGFCSGIGPWQLIDGDLVNVNDGNLGRGVNKQRVHLGDLGQGVNKKRVDDAEGTDPGTGECGLLAWMQALSVRMRRVRVCCGDWSRVCGPTPTFKMGLTAVILDPPYNQDIRSEVYSHETRCSDDVRKWALENGDHPFMRICLCGYEGEYEMPGWDKHEWSATGGYGSSQGPGMSNRHKERIWFSPGCCAVEEDRQMDIFDLQPETQEVSS